MRLLGVSDFLEFDPKGRGAKHENVHSIPGWAQCSARRVRQQHGVQMPGEQALQLSCHSVAR